MRMDAHTEASFSINESGYVIRSQRPLRPSLLIVPTRRVVTGHFDRSIAAATDVTWYRGIHGVFQQIAEFYNRL